MDLLSIAICSSLLVFILLPSKQSQVRAEIYRVYVRQREENIKSFYGLFTIYKKFPEISVGR